MPIDRENPQRWVLHVDMDAFYAAVEVKEEPGLQGRPVIVGGTGGRGVVCSASYEARAFGVHSATPMAQARRLCPEAVFLSPRFELYQRYSRDLHGVFKALTPLVEGIALDEAFLDVSGATALFGPPRLIAARLHDDVGRELGLSCSVGGGPNKLVAKLASKAAKPTAARRGTRPGPATVLVAEPDVLDFLWPMPVGALWGVGRASVERLNRLGVSTVGSLAALPVEAVVGALGKAAGQLVHDLAWGRDERPVVADRAAKSIGHEETYPVDLTDRAELHRRLVLMADSVAARVRHHGFVARTVVLKLRYDDFTTITRSHTFSSPQVTGPGFWNAAAAMLDAAELRSGVRLLGLTASGLLPAGTGPGQQLQLDLTSQGTTPGATTPGAPGPGAPGPGAPGPGAPGPEGSEGEVPAARPGPDGAAAGKAESGPGAWDRASQAIDAVRARFGQQAVGPATGLGSRRRPHWPAGPSGHG